MAWPTWIDVVPARRRPPRRRAWLSPAQRMMLLVNCLVVGAIVAALWGSQ
jgi:hypothetical protein